MWRDHGPETGREVTPPVLGAMSGHRRTSGARDPALRDYQHGLPVPPPPPGSFDGEAAQRGGALFGEKCATCHVGATGTDNNSGKLHPPAETGVDAAYAARTANKEYRTTPLRALWQHPPYFHDGSAATLASVVAHYNKFRGLGLTGAQQRDLVEYLKSL
jgi:Cytochrome c